MMTTSTMTVPARPRASTEEMAISTKQKETLNSSEHGRKLARLRGHSKSNNSLKRIRGRGSSALHCVHSSSSLLMDRQAAQGYHTTTKRDNSTPHPGR